MLKAFGTDFIIVNDVYQPLLSLSKTKNGNYYMHLATVRRGLKEYIAYINPDDRIPKVWLEEVNPKEPCLLQKIENDNEWHDLLAFLFDNKLLEFGTRKEIKTSKFGLTGKGI